MVNPDLTVLLKGEQRWRLEVGRFKMPFDACISSKKTFPKYMHLDGFGKFVKIFVQKC